MDAKVRKISRPEGVSIRTALVYDGELNPSVVSNGYFDALVLPFVFFVHSQTMPTSTAYPRLVNSV